MLAVLLAVSSGAGFFWSGGVRVWLAGMLPHAVVPDWLTGSAYERLELLGLAARSLRDTVAESLILLSCITIHFAIRSMGPPTRFVRLWGWAALMFGGMWAIRCAYLDDLLPQVLLEPLDTWLDEHLTILRVILWVTAIGPAAAPLWFTWALVARWPAGARVSNLRVWVLIATACTVIMEIDSQWIEATLEACGLTADGAEYGRLTMETLNSVARALSTALIATALMRSVRVVRSAAEHSPLERDRARVSAAAKVLMPCAAALGMLLVVGIPIPDGTSLTHDTNLGIEALLSVTAIPATLPVVAWVMWRRKALVAWTTACMLGALFIGLFARYWLESPA